MGINRIIIRTAVSVLVKMITGSVFIAIAKNKDKISDILNRLMEKFQKAKRVSRYEVGGLSIDVVILKEREDGLVRITPVAGDGEIFIEQNELT